METFYEILTMIWNIFIVLALFNVTIFVHELGHFLAARWRGLYVDRFQVWFGKPIWKKEINGVVYGLGSIPAGGFVSLPQMAPMQSVEGESRHTGDLPPIKPLDKIIVAAAGPLFSVLMALAFAFIVWGIGRPLDLLETRSVGWVKPDSPAERAGFQAGDEILKIDGQDMLAWTGDLERGIVENIKFSEHEKITFLVKRPGVAEPITLESGFDLPETAWWKRRGLRQVGIAHQSEANLRGTIDGSPADVAGLQDGDVIIGVNGQELLSPALLAQIIDETPEEAMQLKVQRGEDILNVEITPKRPLTPEGAGPMLGIQYGRDANWNEALIYPGPIEQVCSSVMMMWITITKVIAPGSSVGVQHLSGPVGIAKTKYEMLKTEDGWRRVIWFTVFFNINLAILNMLPFPVLDGGHITMAILEMIKGRPIQAKLLEYIQMGFALLLISFMLYVTTKDVPELFTSGGGESQEVRF